MKYIKGYLLLGLTLILGSCSDFLDRDPDQILTNDQIFSDAKMINSVLAGFYGDTENWGQSFATPASFTKVDDGCVTDGAVITCRNTVTINGEFIHINIFVI